MPRVNAPAPKTKKVEKKQTIKELAKPYAAAAKKALKPKPGMTLKEYTKELRKDPKISKSKDKAVDTRAAKKTAQKLSNKVLKDFGIK
jgi:cell division protein YceG involved in septum cleavage